MLAVSVPGAGAGGGGPGNGSGDFRLRPMAFFKQPMYVHGPPGAGKLLFVVERPGKIKVLRGNRKSTFLDIRSLVRCCDGERGLFSVAFADWRNSRRFYVYFTDKQGDLRISEFKRKKTNRLRASPKSRRDLLEINHSGEDNHNGGQLQWVPDNRLYFATGDGGSGGDPEENAQDKESLLGKMIRINPLRRGRNTPYGIPRDNPYVGKAGRNEIFSIGLRNPWRWSFNGRKLAIGDVGQDDVEEVDYEKLGKANGANFGWDNYEGNTLFEGPPLANHDAPIHTYSSSDGTGNCGIAGGYVVHDPRLRGLRGRYLYGDICSGEIRSLIPRLSGARDDQSTGLTVDGLNSFGTDARKHVYAIFSGTVARIVPD